MHSPRRYSAPSAPGTASVIRDDGLILPIGYLITEAETIWLTANNGTVVQGYPLAYDFTSGFGLVQPLGRLGVKPLVQGSAALVETDDDVIVIGNGGHAHALKARIMDKRNSRATGSMCWTKHCSPRRLIPSGAARRWWATTGSLVGIGSLLVQEQVDEDTVHGNMFVPIDLLAPIVDDLIRQGRRSGLMRPWLGLYAAEVRATRGQRTRQRRSRRARGRASRRCRARSRRSARQRAGAIFRAMWRLGPAGTEIPLVLFRDGTRVDVKVHSAIAATFSEAASAVMRSIGVARRLSGSLDWLVGLRRAREHRQMIGCDACQSALWTQTRSSNDRGSIQMRSSAKIGALAGKVAAAGVVSKCACSQRNGTAPQKPFVQVAHEHASDTGVCASSTRRSC